MKQALWQGGIQRANKPEGKRNTPGLQQWSDLVSSQLRDKLRLTRQHNAQYVLQALLYAGQLMADDRCLVDYSVPKVCAWQLAHDCQGPEWYKDSWHCAGVPGAARHRGCQAECTTRAWLSVLELRAHHGFCVTRTKMNKAQRSPAAWNGTSLLACLRLSTRQS